MCEFIQLRLQAETNSRMTKLNVQLQGLGHCHPLLQGVTSAREVRKLKVQLKLLAGDYWTNDIIGERNNTSTACVLCHDVTDNDIHVFSLNQCPETNAPKDRIHTEMKNYAVSCKPPLDLQDLEASQFLQFLCDPG